LRKSDPGVIDYRFWPEKWWGIDAWYTLLSIPLAWLVLQLYWHLTPDLYQGWSMPDEVDRGEIKKLFLGINMVGIWDELFFINTVFAVLRSLFRYRVSNLVQAVVYTSVLYDMVFVGAGPYIVFLFAWTQGAMYERSGRLFWVIMVHLIVDFFLVAAIVQSYYPELGMDYLWRHGF